MRLVRLTGRNSTPPVSTWKEDHDDDERDKQAVFADVGAKIFADRLRTGWWVSVTISAFSPERMMARMIVSWLASAFESSATIRPSFMT